jgi:hypothetical protein
MGLIVEIYRGSYNSSANVFKNVSRLVITNLEGPFEPSAEMPAAIMEKGNLGTIIITPDMAFAQDNGITEFDMSKGLLMYGGTYASTSDSRFHEKVRALGGTGHVAIPIHDFFESWENYNRMD